MAALDQRFTAVLQTSPAKDGWTYVVCGTHKPPTKVDLRRAIGKEAGDTATVQLDERLDD